MVPHPYFLWNTAASFFKRTALALVLLANVEYAEDVFDSDDGDDEEEDEVVTENKDDSSGAVNKTDLLGRVRILSLRLLKYLTINPDPALAPPLRLLYFESTLVQRASSP